MRGIDFSSWHSVLITLIGLALFTLISIGIRLLMMFTVQQRRERMNRQINERLRTLIAAYRTLGGSFTGNLAVDPTHLRDLRRRSEAAGEDPGTVLAEDDRDEQATDSTSDRPRRIRDAVEAALSDVILLGTEEHIRLASRAVRELVAGRPVHTSELVVSLRDFIREALSLAPVPSDAEIPRQGPTRPAAGSGGGRSARGAGQTGGGAEGRGGRAGGGSGGMGGGMGAGMGLGMGGAGLGLGTGNDDDGKS